MRHITMCDQYTRTLRKDFVELSKAAKAFLKLRSGPIWYEMGHKIGHSPSLGTNDTSTKARSSELNTQLRKTAAAS
jgi:hypothetical protein